MATIPVHNPAVPFLGLIPGGLRHGLMVRVKGQMSSTGQRFVVNLMCGAALSPMDDIAIHLSVRPDEYTIVRNHCENNSWGTEERHGGCPILPGQAYEILILAINNCYKIAVNGSHYCEFVYRIPLQRVSFVNVSGDTTISYIGFEGDPTTQSGITPSAPVIAICSSNPSAIPFNPVVNPSTYMIPSNQPPYVPFTIHPTYAPPPPHTPPNPIHLVQHVQPPYNPQAAALSYGNSPSNPQYGGMVTTMHTTPAFNAQTPQMMNQHFIPPFSGKKER